MTQTATLRWVLLAHAAATLGAGVAGGWLLLAGPAPVAYVAFAVCVAALAVTIVAQWRLLARWDR